MINKIKDFLKNKLRRKAPNQLSDQDDLLDDIAFESEDKTNPGFKANAIEETTDEK